MHRQSITQSELKDFLNYDPLTGLFVWLVNKGTAKAGRVAGHVRHDGYVIVGVNGKEYLAHRLAWLQMTGEIPEHQLDHRNQDPSDNRWENLREVTHKENHHNLPLRCTNKSGTTGVYHCKKRGRGFAEKWIAFIAVNGKRKHLGTFTTKAGAVAARKAANVKHGYHRQHGAVRVTPRRLRQGGS